MIEWFLNIFQNKKKNITENEINEIKYKKPNNENLVISKIQIKTIINKEIHNFFLLEDGRILISYSYYKESEKKYNSLINIYNPNIFEEEIKLDLEEDIIQIGLSYSQKIIILIQKYILIYEINKKGISLIQKIKDNIIEDSTFSEYKNGKYLIISNQINNPTYEHFESLFPETYDSILTFYQLENKIYKYKESDKINEISGKILCDENNIIIYGIKDTTVGSNPLSNIGFAFLYDKDNSDKGKYIFHTEKLFQWKYSYSIDCIFLMNNFLLIVTDSKSFIYNLNEKLLIDINIEPDIKFVFKNDNFFFFIKYIIEKKKLILKLYKYDYNMKLIGMEENNINAKIHIYDMIKGNGNSLFINENNEKIYFLEQ